MIERRDHALGIDLQIGPAILDHFALEVDLRGVMTEPDFVEQDVRSLGAGAG